LSVLKKLLVHEDEGDFFADLPPEASSYYEQSSEEGEATTIDI
jgi:hypothetical protein